MTQTTNESSTTPRLNHLISKIAKQTPEGVPGKPEGPKGFDQPVAWLGGRELVASLKMIALYCLFGGKLDSRDWMTGIANLVEDDSARVPDGANVEAKEAVYTRAVKTWQAAGDPVGDEFWFDYVADTGDGQMPTYNIAYLSMRHLQLQTKDGKQLLPRGKFLFMGGDTAYHVADYETLAKRFQAPFWWAYKELVCEGEIPEAELSKRRPLFGIPGNHDYYDALDGFNRQFRRPYTGEDDPTSRDPLLQLPTFERHQEASYVALRLPFDWWLWGLDIERSEIDFRQETFFKQVHEEYQPKKLIVATPSPTTVFGKYLVKDKPLSKVFEAIGLKRPFLKEKEELEPGECRLDLSGDVHQYARYWGPKTDGEQKPRGEQDQDRPYDNHYASVVSGGGGAFFDPTNTYLGEIKEQALYPRVRESLTAMSKEILNFSNIRSGGYVHFLGAFIAFIICFAAIIAPNTRVLLFPCLPGGCSDGKSVITWGLGFIGISLFLLIPGNVFFKSGFKRIDRRIEAREPEGKDKQERVQKKIAFTQIIVMGLFLLLTALPMGYGIWILRGLRPFTPLGDSLLIFLATVWAGLMVVLYIQSTERLNKQASERLIRERDYWPPCLLLVVAALVFCASLWLFGQGEHSLPAALFADMAFMTVVSALSLGLIIGLAWSVGGERHGWKGKIGYFVMGLWHTLLQLTVAVLWTLSLLYLFKAHGVFTLKTMWRVVLAVIILLVAYSVFRRIGIRYVNRNYRKRLVATWILYGSVMILLPVLYLLKRGEITQPELHAMPLWLRIGLCIAGGVIGAFMACVWFGWYLAVALVYNGHNNEAGGAARLEGYKQFMRIRLRKEDLTAYVIGFDKAQPASKDLIPNLRLIEQFTLTVKRN